MKRTMSLAAAFSVTALASFAPAAELPLQADVQPLTLRARTDAPAIVEIKLHSRRQKIVDGVLELKLMAGVETLYRLRTPELALAPGITTQRLLLPSTSARNDLGVEAELKFVQAKESQDLGRFPMTVESAAARQYLIGICGSGNSLPPDRPRLWQALRPDWLFHTGDGNSRTIATVPVWFPPEDLPSAMGLCALDLITVEGPSFAALEGKQLSALSSWVEAGGSLCVIPSAPLDAEHLQFLNTLAGGADPAVEWEHGKPLVLRPSPILLRRAGLGRLAIILAPPSDNAEAASPAWRRASLFLAKTLMSALRSAPVASESDLEKMQYGEPRLPNLPATYRSYPAPPRDRITEIKQALYERLPTTSKMIPLPVIAGILGAFVLLVGPGEWIVLGWLQRRRWTWITFPTLAAGFTLLGIRSAEYYLGRDDIQSTVIITDVGQAGRVFRENQFQLRIPGRDKTLATEQRQSLARPCYPLRDGYSTAIANPVPEYEGQVSGHYVLRQSLQQWNPAVQRALTFGPGGEKMNIHWPEIGGRQLAAQPDPADYLKKQVEGDGWSVEVLQLGQTARDPQLRPSLTSTLSVLEGPEVAHPWAAALSPSARADALDLAIYDPTDPQELLVVATKSTPGTMHIVRRLYRTDEEF